MWIMKQVSKNKLNTDQEVEMVTEKGHNWIQVRSIK